MKFISKLIWVPSLILIIFNLLNAQVKDDSNEFSYALKLYNQKFYDLAAQQFIKYYNNYPLSQNVDEAKYYSGMSLLTLEQYNKARVEFQSLALEFPKSSRAGESWYKIGECYEKLGNYIEAAKAFEALKTLYPQNPLAADGCYRSGINYTMGNDLAKAKSVFNVVLERYPESQVYYKTQLELSIVYYQLDNIEQAKIFLNKVLASSKNEEDLSKAFYNKGLMDFNLGYSSTALQSFNEVIARFPRSEFAPLASLYSGKIYLKNNQFVKAIENFERAEQSEKDSQTLNEIRLSKGDAFFLDNKFSLADKEYAKVSTEQNDSLLIIVLLKKALSAKKQGFNSKINTIIEPVLNNSFKNTQVLFPTLLVYLDWLEDKNDYNTAINLLVQFLKFEWLRPNQKYQLVDKLGHFYKLSSRWKDIIRELKPYVNSAVNSRYTDDFIFYTALAYKESGEFNESAYLFDVLLKQYSASGYYSDVNGYKNELLDYEIFDQKLALLNLTELYALDGPVSDKAFLVGKIYFNDLKEYQKARIQFEKATEAEPAQKGDAYLFLGKTLLKLAGSPNVNEQESVLLMKEAAQHFQIAVENTATCSNPDEASWLMVQSRISVDNLSAEKQKAYIEALLKKYPESQFVELWQYSLAHELAFAKTFETDSKNYFQILIKNYKSSDRYPTYLFDYAKLIKEKETESAITLFKNIALDYSDAPEAVFALWEVAQYYEEKGAYKDAVQLYSRLLDYYYYSDLAQDAEFKIGELYLQAGQYDEAVAALKNKVSHPFLKDIVLSREFLPAQARNQLVFLGMALKNQDKVELARDYFTQYLTSAPDGPLKNKVALELGEVYYNEGRYQLAIDNFKNIAKSDTSLYNQGLLYRADIFFKQGDFKQAARVYEELSDIYKNTAKEKEIKGNFIISKIKTGAISESEKLIAQYKKKFSGVSDFLAAFTIEIGDYQRKNKNFDSALRSFKTVKSKYSNSSHVDDADYFTALTYITLNKNEEAFAILNGFYNKYPKSDKLPYVFNTLGSLYFRVEKYDNAIVAFKNALKSVPDRELSRQIQGNLIKTYTLTGFWDAAQGLARQYVEEYPDAEDKIDKKMVIAQAFINLNQFQNAVDYLKRMKLEADSEKEPEIQFYIGEAYLKAGQYEDAIAEFVKIPLLSRKTKLQWEASALYYSGQAYEKLGRIPDAVRMYREIIDRPGIDLILKRDAEKRITQIQG